MSKPNLFNVPSELSLEDYRCQFESLLNEPINAWPWADTYKQRILKWGPDNLISRLEAEFAAYEKRTGFWRWWYKPADYIPKRAYYAYSLIYTKLDEAARTADPAKRSALLKELENFRVHRLFALTALPKKWTGFFQKIVVFCQKYLGMLALPASATSQGPSLPALAKKFARVCGFLGIAETENVTPERLEIALNAQKSTLHLFVNSSSLLDSHEQHKKIKKNLLTAAADTTKLLTEAQEVLDRWPELYSALTNEMSDIETLITSRQQGRKDSQSLQSLHKQAIRLVETSHNKKAKQQSVLQPSSSTTLVTVASPTIEEPRSTGQLVQDEIWCDYWIARGWLGLAAKTPETGLTVDEIKFAFRQESLKLHPDKTIDMVERIVNEIQADIQVRDHLTQYVTKAANRAFQELIKQYQVLIKIVAKDKTANPQISSLPNEEKLKVALYTHGLVYKAQLTSFKGEETLKEYQKCQQQRNAARDALKAELEALRQRVAAIQARTDDLKHQIDEERRLREEAEHREKMRDIEIAKLKAVSERPKAKKVARTMHKSTIERFQHSERNLSISNSKRNVAKTQQAASTAVTTLPILTPENKIISTLSSQINRVFVPQAATTVNSMSSLFIPSSNTISDDEVVSHKAKMSYPETISSINPTTT